jgi:hypothetical protein
MAIADDYQEIAAELRRIQAERACRAQPKALLSHVTAPYLTVRSIQTAIRSGRLLPQQPGGAENSPSTNRRGPRERAGIGASQSSINISRRSGNGARPSPPDALATDGWRQPVPEAV